MLYRAKESIINLGIPPLLAGLQSGTTTLEISLAVPQKIGHSTTGGSCNTSPGHISKDIPTGKKDTCSTMFIAALFIIARPFHGCFVPNSKKGQSDHTLVFILEFHVFCKLHLGYSKFWANIHLSVSTYCVSYFVIGLPHSG